MWSSAHGASPRSSCFGSVTRHVILPAWSVGWMNWTCKGSPAVLMNPIASDAVIVRLPGSSRVAPITIVFWAAPFAATGAGPLFPAHPAKVATPNFIWASPD